jgi:hypothetical protein
MLDVAATELASLQNAAKSQTLETIPWAQQNSRWFTAQFANRALHGLHIPLPLASTT